MTDRAPYRLAARAAAFLAVFAAVVFAADRAVVALALRGIRVVPKVPPTEMTSLLDAEGKVLVLGDSVMTYLPKGDDGPTLVAMIAAEVPVGVHDGSHRGRGAAFAAAQIDALLRMGVRPAAVLVEVNLANFSPAWEENPGMQEPDLVRMLRTGVVLPIRAATVFKYRFGLPSEEEFQATPVWIGGKQDGVIGEPSSGEGPAPVGVDPEERIRRRALIRYATDLDRSWTLPLLVSALERLQVAGVPCVAFVPPIDVRTLEGHFGGPRVNDLVLLKLGSVAKRVRDTGTLVTPRSHLPPELFVHPPEHFDEHLSPSARRIVASGVAADLAEVLPPR